MNPGAAITMALIFHELATNAAKYGALCDGEGQVNVIWGVEKDEEDGFTLIELMVVVLIIAILLAIAIPTFLGAQDRARDRAAQSDLRNAITAAKTIATDDAGELDTVTTGKWIHVDG